MICGECAGSYGIKCYPCAIYRAEKAEAVLRRIWDMPDAAERLGVDMFNEIGAALGIARREIKADPGWEGSPELVAFVSARRAARAAKKGKP